MVRRATRRTPLVRFVGASLAILLAGGQGTSVNVLASEPEAAPSAAAALSVASEPTGASVYVDGALAGATPVTVEGVPAGQHRVRVVKDGYLENSRVVSVRPGQGESVQVRMTPAAGGTRYAVQQDPDTGGGGGGSKILWIALGVAAVGAGAYFLLKDSNEAPSAGSINANPAVGLAGATSISFSAAGANDPDGDNLTFSWNFGDGATGSGQTTTHTYASAGSFNVSLTVSDGDAQATANGSVTVRSLSGRWSGAIVAGGSLITELNITQTSAALSGMLTLPQFPPNDRNWTVSGSVSGPLAVTFSAAQPGFQPFTFNGTADADVNRLTGTVTGSGFTGQSWTLTRQ
jgi:hypothetical protein